jgi:hypothetical protein
MLFKLLGMVCPGNEDCSHKVVSDVPSLERGCFGLMTQLFLHVCDERCVITCSRSNVINSTGICLVVMGMTNVVWLSNFRI